MSSWMCSAPPNHPTTQLLEPPPRRAGKQPPCILRLSSLYLSLCAVLTPAMACASRYIHEDFFGVLSALCPGASCSAVRSWLYFGSGRWLKVAWQSVCCRRCSWVKVRSAWPVSFLPLFVDTSHGNRSYPDAIVSRGLCRSRVPLENCQN